jgi:hypothetical protein
MKNLLRSSSLAKLNVLSFSLLLGALFLPCGPVQAQGFDGSFNLPAGGEGGVTFGVGGPQGTLTNPSLGGSMDLGGSDPGAASDAAAAAVDWSAPGMDSLGAQGTIGRTSFKTDKGPAKPILVDPPNNNFGLSNARTGLMAPRSVDNSGIRNAYGPFGALDYGFNPAPPTAKYDSIYGLQRMVNNGVDALGNVITGGLIPNLSGRQVLPPVSTGSVDGHSINPFPGMHGR